MIHSNLTSAFLSCLDRFKLLDFIIHYHPKHMQDIYAYINSKSMLWSLDREWTNLNPFWRFWWRRYGSSKADGGHHLSLNSLRQWERERERFCSFKRMWFNQKTQAKSFLYPPALGTIPIGYWASRALGPSSKVRDGIGLYTLGGPYSRLNHTLHAKR